MSPKRIQVGVVRKASSALFALWISASAGEQRGAKGTKVGEDQSMLRRMRQPRPKSASSVRSWPARCLRKGLSIGACPLRCWAPCAQGLQTLFSLPLRDNPIQSIFDGSELSFPLLPCEKKQTPASHPRFCSGRDGFLSQKQVLVCINSGEVVIRSRRSLHISLSRQTSLGCSCPWGLSETPLPW